MASIEILLQAMNDTLYVALAKYIIFKVTTASNCKSQCTVEIHKEHARSVLEMYYEYHSNPP